MSQPDTAIARPLPRLMGFTKEFYEWCARGELRFQRCADCAAWRHVPRETCPTCGSFAWEWARSSGRGSVYTWTVATRAMHPAFQADVPYAPVVVEMDEGVRLLSQVVDCPADALAIGMAVEVVFDKLTPEITLPRFRRVQAA